MRPSSSTSEGLFGRLFADPAVDAAVGDAAFVAVCLDVEAALVLAAADVGLVPADAAAAIAEAARGLDVDIDEVGREAVSTGNPVSPLVARLGAAVPESARPWVHVGATSQDIVDTALVLAHRAAAALVADRADAAADTAAELAVAHRDSVMVARSLGQHALPTTFGLRAAGWLVALRSTASLLRSTAGRLPVQLGGAVGTLAGYGERGFEVRRALGTRLGLPGGDQPLSWHTDRTPWLEYAASLGAVAAAVGKVALDVRLLTATEVAEVRVGAEGGGGSSAMPHKHNPVEAILATSGVLRVPGLVATIYAASVHAHERADGAWHAEWLPLRELVSVVGGASARGAELLAGLTADRDRMRQNLGLTGGAVMAESVAARLSAGLGRAAARDAVAAVARRAATDGTSFRDALLADPVVSGQLDADAVDAALDPGARLGVALAAVDESVRRYGRRTGGLGVTGVRLHAELSGPRGGPVVVMGCSIGSTSKMWESVAAALAAGGHRVVVLDSRGHGRSPVPPGPYRIEDLGADALETLAALDVDEFSYVGLSMGGQVGMWLASELPDRVRRLSLWCTGRVIGTAESWRERAAAVRADGTAAIADAAVARWFTPAFALAHPAVVAGWRREVAAVPAPGYAGCCDALAEADLTERLPAITAPTLVVAGSEDPATPLPRSPIWPSGSSRAGSRCWPRPRTWRRSSRPARQRTCCWTTSAERTTAMDDDDRRRVGEQVRREVLGDAHVDRAAATSPPESRDFQDLITRVAWGDVWSRPGLDRRTRSCLTVSLLAALGHWDELALHVRAAVRNGMSRDDIAEVLLHTAVYAGVPVGNHALAVAWRALDESAPEPGSGAEPR